MGIPQGRVYGHWNYFLAIESDLLNVARYIEPCTENYKAFSLELSRILLASASEADVLLMELCRRLNPSAKADSIGKYKSVILGEFPGLAQFEVSIPRWGLSLTPWSAWAKDNRVPLWWTACNKVKHHRGSEFKRANLKNTLNSVAALFLVNLYFHKEEAESGILIPSPELLRVNDQNYNGATVEGVDVEINYKL